MIIGCTKELKNNEFRVGLTPSNVRELTKLGNKVLIEFDAGIGSNFLNDEYEKAGAILLNAFEIWKQAEMIVKVKEPEPSEFKYLREDLILFTYLHLASNEKLYRELLRKKVTAIAYETIKKDGYLPCLQPMSEIAGKLAVIEGSKYLEKPFGGKGILLANIKNVEPANILILGGGVAGCSAAMLASSLGINVVVLDINVEKVKLKLNSKNIIVDLSNDENINKYIKRADLIIGTVLIPGGKTPQLIQEKHLKLMKKGTVLVDVAIDQGGCFETSKPTTHENPIFVKEGIVHYCVCNMPGAVPNTSTIALTNSTINYVKAIANLGLENALIVCPELKLGISTRFGKCQHFELFELFK